MNSSLSHENGNTDPRHEAKQSIMDCLSGAEAPRLHNIFSFRGSYFFFGGRCFIPGNYFCL